MTKYNIKTDLEYSTGTYRASIRGFDFDIKVLESTNDGYMITLSNKDFSVFSELRIIPTKDSLRISKYVDQNNTTFKEDIKFTDVSMISMSV